MERGRCTKPELPAPGARAARGQEAMSNGCGGGSPAPSTAWRTAWWREGARGAAGQGGQDSVYCCGLGNTSLFTGEAARRPERNKSGRQCWGRSHGRAGEGRTQPSSPARTEGVERGGNSSLNFLSRIKVVCAHSRKCGKRRKARVGSSHCPTSDRRCEAAGKSSLLRAQRGQCGRNPRQRATPRAGSLGTGAVP